MEAKIKCNNGSFVGMETDGLIIWKGIPYATQPVGKLRWQKPLPAADDDGVYEAVKPGHVPIGPVNDSEGTAEFGEDCLVLNIYCNTSCNDSKKPVATPPLTKTSGKSSRKTTARPWSSTTLLVCKKTCLESERI